MNVAYRSSGGSKDPAEPTFQIQDGESFERALQLERSTNLPNYWYTVLRSFHILRSAWNDRFPGWRGGIAGFIVLASVMLTLNISALLWSATHLDRGHYATLAIGSYESVSNLSGWVHLAINVSSVALLAGSNYCMQCLSSPTRAEVDAAHAEGSYLNIGTSSWRNVLRSRKRRIFILSLLTLSSVVMPSM